MEEENIKLICLRCRKELTGKQSKWCSSLCYKKVRRIKRHRKKWKIIMARAKANKIEKKIRRKFLIEQEIKKREGDKNVIRNI